MTVTVHSTRFGRLEIAAEAVLEFPSGLIGLGGNRWTLLARDEGASFIWLHSIDDPELALPVANPWQFFSDYEVELSDDEAARIGVTDPEETLIYVTVRAGERLEDFTANLRAPIVIAHGRGFQVINQSPDAPVRAPLFAGAPAEQPEGAAA
jgi:flagellar assembly factor FliW